MFTVARIRLGTMAAMLAAVVLPMSAQATQEQPSSTSLELVAQATHKSDCQKAVTHPKRCPNVGIFGHRGRQWKTNTNENTAPAFEADLKHGAAFESDGWVLADGRPVIFHDKKLKRVIDPASFPPGVDGQTLITSLNTAQFRQLRTKGGQPLWTVKHLVRWAGRHHVTGMIENKYASLPPETVAYWIHHFHANVWIYQTPKCKQSGVIHPEIAAYDIRVGAKYLGGCHPTPEQLADAGYAFTIGSTEMMTPAYVEESHHYGLEVGNFNSGQTEVWTQLVNAGADYLLVPHPGSAVKWARG